MWEVISNLVNTVKDALGIEIPEVPADLGSIAEAATGAGETLAGAGEAATEAATDAVGGLSETAAGAGEVAAGLSEASSGAATDAVTGVGDAMGEVPPRL